jgi:hypothetical protein
MSPPRSKRNIKINALTQANLMRLLLDGTRDCTELAEETGLHYVTVLHYTRELHRAGAAFICDWHPDSRGYATLKVYKLGLGKDKKRPRISNNEKAANYRARKKLKQLALVVAGAGQLEQRGNGRVLFTPLEKEAA